MEEEIGHGDGDGVGDGGGYLWAPRMDTIYESDEELDADDSSEQRSSNVFSEDAPTSSSSASDSPTGLLTRNVRAWCDATGLPTTVLVETRDQSFRLHKLPLVSRSAYFKHALMDSCLVKLPEDFPGGAEVFQLVASFCYDPKLLHLDSSNVAVLRCAAEFLEMGHDDLNGGSNLCKITELYLTQVAFRCWQASLLVLKQSQKLLPLAEEVLIVTRCIDALANLACRPGGMEISSAAAGTGDENNQEQAVKSPILKDLLELPLSVFGRFVGAIRAQGMEERYISVAVIEYAKQHLLHGTTAAANSMNTTKNVALLEAMVRLLPLERFLLPVSLLFALHARATAWEASETCRAQLEARIILQLELVTVEDMLFAAREFKQNSNRFTSLSHIDTMQQMVATFMSQQEMILEGSEMVFEHKEEFAEGRKVDCYSHLAVSAVSKVWDEFLAEVAKEPSLSPRKFAELTRAIPAHLRTTHDQLYSAIHTYLKSHSFISAGDRLVVCKALNCQRLSKEVCIHAVQDEHMPLRMIVQAMFMQQLQSRAPNGDAAAAAGSRNSGIPRPRNKQQQQQQEQDPHQGYEQEQGDGLPLGLLLQRDAASREASYLKDDFRAAKARLRELQVELQQMKRNMKDARLRQQQQQQQQLGSSARGAPPPQARNKGSSCICQVLGPQTSSIHLGQRLARSLQKLGLANFWKVKCTSSDELPSPRSSSSSSGMSGTQLQQQQQGLNKGSKLLLETDYVHGAAAGAAAGRICHFSASPAAAATVLRAGSFRRTEPDADTTKSRHSRHHSFS